MVCVDPETVTDEELQSMHKLGARGVRLNLRTRWERMDEQGFRTILEKYADRIRSLGWCLQLFVALDQISLIAPIVPSLGVPVVFDHLGSPDKSKPPRLQTGYTEFLHLLKSGLAWTKLSGTYRFDTTPELDEYIKEILRMAPDRVVWASDWPHSGGTEANPGGVRTKVQDYRVVDDPSFVRRCKGWCGGDEGLISKIWVDNPRRLWQYDGDD